MARIEYSQVYSRFELFYKVWVNHWSPLRQPWLVLTAFYICLSGYLYLAFPVYRSILVYIAVFVLGLWTSSIIAVLLDAELIWPKSRLCDMNYTHCFDDDGFSSKKKDIFVYFSWSQAQYILEKQKCILIYFPEIVIVIFKHHLDKDKLETLLTILDKAPVKQKTFVKI